jgi:hypothetical protein
MKTLFLLLSCGAWLAAADLPKWFQLGGEWRVRAEGRTGFGFTEGNDDAYFLHRIRVNMKLKPVSWFEANFQGNDSRVAGIDASRPLGIFKNPFDIRQAYVRFGSSDSIFKLSVGRQLLNYGGQRLLGPLDWTNNSRNWDAVKLEIGNNSAKVDLFASSVVETDPNRRVDQPKRGHNIHGAYGSFTNLLPLSVVEPYLLYKTGAGSGVASMGVRVASRPGQKKLRGNDYQVEVIKQTGRFQFLAHDAWAVALVGGHTFGASQWKPRVSAEFSGASGDGNPGDRHHRTFDHLLGTNHLFYGLVDAVGWQNMRNVRIGLDAQPRKGLQLIGDFHWLWLGSPNDALYDVAGKATVRPKAGNTARAIGTELDFQVVWNARPSWKLGGGVGHLFAGSYLKLNAGGSGQTFPYLFSQYTF